MSSLTRPDVPSWRRHLDEEQERRLDATADFERQREATQRLTRLCAFWMSVGCFAVVAAIVLAVTH